MFNQQKYINEYKSANYCNVSVTFKKNDEHDRMLLENIKEYAKDHKLSMQKTIIFALEKFLSDNGYI